MSMIIFAAAMAFAAPEPTAAPIPPSDQAPVAVKQTSIKPSTDQRRVCIKEAVTGTRIARKVCQTRADWIAQGVDPLARR